jgi:hypothetical protein
MNSGISKKFRISIMNLSLSRSINGGHINSAKRYPTTIMGLLFTGSENYGAQLIRLTVSSASIVRTRTSGDLDPLASAYI